MTVRCRNSCREVDRIYTTVHTSKLFFKIDVPPMFEIDQRSSLVKLIVTLIVEYNRDAHWWTSEREELGRTTESDRSPPETGRQ